MITESASFRPRTRGLSPVIWILGVFFVFIAGILGLVLGAWLIPREVQVERPVEVVQTVEKIVKVPVELTSDQVLGLKEHALAMSAARTPNVAYMETAVMPCFNRVKVSVLMSDTINEKVPRDGLRVAVEAALREGGIEVIPFEDKRTDFNTTVFVVMDVLFQDGSGIMIGDVKLNLNQTVLCYTGDVWRKSNITMHSYGTTISYGSANYEKIPGVAAGMAKEAATVLRKADKIGQAQAARR